LAAVSSHTSTTGERVPSASFLSSLGFFTIGGRKKNLLSYAAAACAPSKMVSDGPPAGAGVDSTGVPPSVHAAPASRRRSGSLW
jgi:hypothetical protein